MTKPCLFSRMILGLILLGSATSATAQDLSKTLEEAASLVEEGRLEKAMKAYVKADQLADGKSHEALIGLSSVYYRLKEFESASLAARRILELPVAESTRGVAFNLLGIALLERAGDDPDKWAEAENALQQAIALSSGDTAAAKYSLALVLEATDRAAEAYEIVAKLLGDDPDHSISDRARVLLCRVKPPETSTPPWLDPDESLTNLASDAVLAHLPNEPGDKRSEGTMPGVDGGEVTPPVKIFAPVPLGSELSHRLRGEVIVQAIISKNGCVIHRRIFKSRHTALNQIAMDAIGQWVFRPSELKGEPVDVYYNLTVNFGRPR